MCIENRCVTCEKNADYCLKYSRKQDFVWSLYFRWQTGKWNVQTRTPIPAHIYLFKVNNGNTKVIVKCLKLKLDSNLPKKNLLFA